MTNSILNDIATGCSIVVIVIVLTIALYIVWATAREVPAKVANLESEMVNLSLLRYPLAEDGTGFRYGEWIIRPSTWLRPVAGFDWDWYHVDYDGPEDRRAGTGSDVQDCIDQIHEWEDDHAAEG